MSPDPEARHGVLVLVVGPSGAGKDTLMRRARDRLGIGSGVQFVRRVVTRPADASEDNDAATAADFAQAAQRGDFALAWHAHGLRYGVPRRRLDGLTRGEIVVVNGSRMAVAPARRVFALVRVVLVTAPPAVLASRIEARGRDLDAAQRLTRDAVSLHDLRPDLVIDNAGPLESAVAEFLLFLESLGEHRARNERA